MFVIMIQSPRAAIMRQTSPDVAKTSTGEGETLDASSARLWKTESQRWGSFYTKKRPPGADPFSSQRSCWRKPRSKCDVTEYGDRFDVDLFFLQTFYISGQSEKSTPSLLSTLTCLIPTSAPLPFGKNAENRRFVVLQ